MDCAARIRTRDSCSSVAGRVGPPDTALEGLAVLAVEGRGFEWVEVCRDAILLRADLHVTAPVADR